MLLSMSCDGQRGAIISFQPIRICRTDGALHSTDESYYTTIWSMFSAKIWDPFLIQDKNGQQGIALMNTGFSFLYLFSILLGSQWLIMYK